MYVFYYLLRSANFLQQIVLSTTPIGLAGMRMSLSCGLLIIGYLNLWLSCYHKAAINLLCLNVVNDFKQALKFLFITYYVANRIDSFKMLCCCQVTLYLTWEWRMEGCTLTVTQLWSRSVNSSSPISLSLQKGSSSDQMALLLRLVFLFLVRAGTSILRTIVIDMTNM